MAEARSARFEQLRPQDSARRANHLPDLRIHRVVSMRNAALGQFTEQYGRAINGLGEIRSLGSLACTYLRASQMHRIIDEAYDPDFLADPVEGPEAYRALQEKLGRFIVRQGLHKPLAAPVGGFSIYGRSEPSSRRPQRALRPMIALDIFDSSAGDQMCDEYDAIIDYLGNEGYPVHIISRPDGSSPLTPHVTIGRFYEHLWRTNRLDPNDFLSEYIRLPGHVTLEGVKPQYIALQDNVTTRVPRPRTQ